MLEILGGCPVNIIVRFDIYSFFRFQPKKNNLQLGNTLHKCRPELVKWAQLETETKKYNTTTTLALCMYVCPLSLIDLHLTTACMYIGININRNMYSVVLFSLLYIHVLGNNTCMYGIYVSLEYFIYAHTCSCMSVQIITSTIKCKIDFILYTV